LDRRRGPASAFAIIFAGGWIAWSSPRYTSALQPQPRWWPEREKCMDGELRAEGTAESEKKHRAGNLRPPVKLTVWYNTKCPVCNAGIAWQRNRLVRAARAGLIEFRDINLEPEALSRFGASLENVRRRLHATDAEGRLHVGADCAIAIWQATPSHAWLGRLLSLPVIHAVVMFGYDRFADALCAWNRWKGHW
jgi:predicted DCC family thiol-disulfide oxidoreductase YuxK